MFEKPLTFREGRDRLKPLTDFPYLTMLSPSRASFEILLGYANRMPLRGNLMTDAVIASQLEANGIKTIYTNDGDFKKFPYLKVKNPLQ